MDERLVKKLLVPSCVIVALSSAFVYELKYIIDLLFFKKKHILIIGILSAPNNYQQRLSIRKTWLQLLSEISGSAYFIIGNEVCEVPPYDRADPYTCIDQPFRLPSNATAETEFSTMKIESESYKLKSSIPSFIGFTFYVRSGITVTKLGILKKLLVVLNKDFQVKLVSAFDNKVLASVTFSSELLNETSETSSPVISKVIRPVKLNAHFEAYLKLEAKDMASAITPDCDIAQWQSEPHIINFIQLWQDNSVIPEPFVEKSCTFLFMTYTILDTEHIKEQINNRTSRLKEWQRLNRKLSVNLAKESELYNDILFVDVVDVYRNLSMKLIHFYKRIMETEYFHYVLKTDDDSFIDLLRVHNQLKTVKRETDHEISQTVGEAKETGTVTKLRFSKFWWWSFFKEFWKVQRAGKWREDHYRSASYPTFPCGGGYVINRGVVDYIGGNKHHLHHFQGEDVSMGIWLSPLPVTRYKIPKVISEFNSDHLQQKIVTRFYGRRHWTHFKRFNPDRATASDMCQWICSRRKSVHIPLCNKVQLNVKTMYATWNEYIRKGFLQ